MFDPDIPLGDQTPVDYTEEFNKSYGGSALCVQAVGREMLLLWPLARPRKLAAFNAGRKKMITATHLLQSSTLSVVAREGTDDYACVLHGPDDEYLTDEQAAPLLLAASSGESLFKHVQLF